MKNWEPFEDYLNQRKKLSNEFLNEIDEIKSNNKKINQSEFIRRNEKKMNKIKNAILTSLDFIQKNVISTREKDKNELMKLKSTFERMFLNCQNINDEIMTHLENDLKNAVSTDIFGEVKIFMVKYFNRFKIQNYENYIERIKMKLLINTDLGQGKLGQLINDRITKDIENQKKLYKEENLLDDLTSENVPSEIYFQRSRRSSMHLKQKPESNPFTPIRTSIRTNIDDNHIINKSKINLLII